MESTKSVLSLLIVPLIVSCFAEQDSWSVSGDYFGQQPPGLEAELFAPGILSTGMHDDAGPIFDADQQEIYFRIAQAPHSIIVFMTRNGDSWSRPEITPFSGKYSDGAPTLTADGTRLYFASNRPLNGEGEQRPDEDLWCVEKNNGTWGEPIHLGPAINSGGGEWGASVAANGTLYFTGSEGDDSGWKLYRSRFVENRLTEREDLGSTINNHDAFSPCIALDESFLVFASTSHPSVMGQADLFVSFQNEDHTWSEPITLGDAVNTDASEYFPSLSPDGRYLFFVSDRKTNWSYSSERRSFEEMVALYSGPQNGRNDIYWVSTEVINKIRVTLE